MLLGCLSIQASDDDLITEQITIKLDKAGTLPNKIESSKKYKVVPYVIPADIYGAGNLAGRGGWTWYTGSASWYYKTGIENILGLKIENGFIRIEPCIPSSWKEYNIKYKWKNAFYNIVVKNPNGKNTGVEKVIVNGVELGETKEIKLEDNGVFNVKVLM